MAHYWSKVLIWSDDTKGTPAQGYEDYHKSAMNDYRVALNWLEKLQEGKTLEDKFYEWVWPL